LTSPVLTFLDKLMGMRKWYLSTGSVEAGNRF